jgi:hypothetical protein
MGEVYTAFRWGNLGESDHLEDPSVDGRIILRSGTEGMGWIYLARHRERWLETANAVMNLRVP